MATIIHFEEISETLADFTTNADQYQSGIQSDLNAYNYKAHIWKANTGTVYSSVAIDNDARLSDLEVTGDLLVATNIKRSAGVDDYISFTNDIIAFYTNGNYSGSFHNAYFGLSAGTTVNTISTDGTFAANSDDQLITMKAAKTYMDAVGAAAGYFDRDAVNGYVYFKTSTDYLGIGTSAPGGPLQIGDGNNASADAGLYLSRELTGSGNGHGYADETTFTRTATDSYSSFDAYVTMLGSANYNHYNAFQDRAFRNTTGTIDFTTSFYSYLRSTTATTITDAYGFFMQTPTLSGGGSITNCYGVYIEALSGTNRWAIYSPGGTDTVYFNGKMGLGRDDPVTYLDLSRSQAGANVDLRIQNSDNTNSASNAKLLLVTGGSSGGNPFILWNNAVEQYVMGIDTADSNILKISASTALGTTDIMGFESDIIYTESGVDFGVGCSSISWPFPDSKGLNVCYDGEGFPMMKLERTNGGAKTNAEWAFYISSSGDFSVRDVTTSSVPFFVEKGASSSVLVVDAASRVGIKTAAPTEALEVEGNIRSNNSIFVQADGRNDWANGALDFGDNAVSTNLGYLLLHGNSYDDGAIRYRTAAAASTIRIGYGSIDINVYNTGAAADAEFGLPDNNIQVNPTSILFNQYANDINFSWFGPGPKTLMYLDGGTSNLGFSTVTPLQNIGTASGDLGSEYKGLHYYNDTGGYNNVALILEGESGLINTTPIAPCLLVMSDRTGGTDLKNYAIRSYQAVPWAFGCYSDDFSAYTTYMRLTSSIMFVDVDIRLDIAYEIGWGSTTNFKYSSGDILVDLSSGRGLYVDTVAYLGFDSSTHFRYSSGDVALYTGSNKTLVLEEPVYEDIQFPGITAKLGAAAPTLATFGTNTRKYTWAINDIADLSSAEVFHKYKQGTDGEWHLHLFTNGTDGTDRTVKYTIYYGITNVDGTFSESSISKQVTIPASTPDRTHLYFDIGTVTGTSFLIGADITCSLKRVAADTGDAPSNDPFVSMVGFHVKCDTLGSRSETSK